MLTADKKWRITFLKFRVILPVTAQFVLKKSRIRDTLNLSTDADNRTNAKITRTRFRMGSGGYNRKRFRMGSGGYNPEKI